MSFILEALKKSEQQRQQKDRSQQKVASRTVSLRSHSAISRSYWLLAAGLPLVLLGGWWSFATLAGAPGQDLVVERVFNPPPAVSRSGPSPPVTAQTVMTPVEVAAAEHADVAPPAPLLPVVVESAPVPRVFAQRETGERPVPAAVAQAEPSIIDTVPPEPVFPVPPIYADLSMELRERMPRLDMSMHFYAPAPERRLVRINGRLLHEGDWLNQDLQIVEITPQGADMDFLGKVFTLPGARR